MRAVRFPDRSAAGLRLSDLHLDDSRLLSVLQYLREYQLHSEHRDLAKNARDNVVLLPENVRVPLNALVAALPFVRSSDIDKWVDLSILYKHVAPMASGATVDVVELAVPVDAVAHFARNTIEPQAYTGLLYSREMVFGKGTFLGAGQQFEALMRPRVNRLQPHEQGP